MSDTDTPDYKFVTYETLDDGMIARIMLDRVETRNAQNRGLLVELNDAFLRAEADDTVRVVIFGGNGPMFSSGHDLGTPQAVEEISSTVTEMYQRLTSQPHLAVHMRSARMFTQEAGSLLSEILGDMQEQLESEEHPDR